VDTTHATYLAAGLSRSPAIAAALTQIYYGVGVLWLVLTLAFEVGFGRFVLGASWERLAADYDVLEGGLLPLGMIVLLFAPLIAGKLRGSVSTG
jgi:hypothetical protein